MRPKIQNAIRNVQNNMGKSLTPGQKMIAVNANLGNDSIHDQQATSRVLYDTLPLNANVVLNFFTTASARAFPLTNVNQNKLQAGESLTVQRVYFCALVTSATDTSNIIEALSVLNTHLYFGEWSVFFDTMQVVKPYPLSSQLPAFNHFAKHTTNESNRMDVNLAIPTDILYSIQLRLDTYTAITNANCRCVMEGTGTLFSPKTQF